MIEITGTFEVDSDQTNNQILINITEHPFKNGEVVKFSTTTSEIEHWSDCICNFNL